MKYWSMKWRSMKYWSMKWREVSFGNFDTKCLLSGSLKRCSLTELAATTGQATTGRWHSFSYFKIKFGGANTPQKHMYIHETYVHTCVRLSLSWDIYCQNKMSGCRMVRLLKCLHSCADVDLSDCWTVYIVVLLSSCADIELSHCQVVGLPRCRFVKLWT
jgi:hypothetical protein